MFQPFVGMNSGDTTTWSVLNKYISEMVSCVLGRRDWNLAAKCHLHQTCTFVLSETHLDLVSEKKTLSLHNTC